MLRSCIIVMILFVSCLHGKLAAEERERIGRAYATDSGELLYEERHLETFANGNMITDRVLYVDPEGRTFGNKRVDFRQDPYVPQFHLANERTGHIEELLRLEPGRIEVRYRERVGQDLRQIRLTAPKNAVADAGFDRVIESHWDELTGGTVLVRRFLVPSRLEFMDWRIRRADDTGDPAQIRFTLEIDSAFLRFVVPAINVIYERSTRRLLRYEGLSNLRDDSGDNHSVRIEFEYISRSARASVEPSQPPAEQPMGTRSSASGTRAARLTRHVLARPEG